MKRRSYGAPFVLVLLSVAACGDDAADEDSVVSAGRAGATAGAHAGGVAGRAGGSAGSSAGANASGRNAAGASGALARAGGGSSATAGSGAVHGDAGEPGAGEGSGGADSGTPPAPGPGGKSAYAVECRGDSLDCNDPALRCLGLRDGNTVLGYSCSNECRTASDCSAAPSGAEATAGCVDFAIAKHCVLVCQDATGQRSCPNGMSCYVYPGAPIGYCLWR